MDYFSQHPWILAGMSVASTWVFNNIISVMISSLPAPTKDSTSNYVYWFKVANTIIGNLKRAQSTHVENSPNFEDAVVKRVNGGTTLIDGAVVAPVAHIDSVPNPALTTSSISDNQKGA